MGRSGDILLRGKRRVSNAFMRTRNSGPLDWRSMALALQRSCMFDRLQISGDPVCHVLQDTRILWLFRVRVVPCFD